LAQRSLTRVGYLRKVFPANTPAEAVVHANVARLVVLYEDLRIELATFQVAAIDGHADWVNDGQYRKRYFLRRAIGTVVELSNGFSQLARDPSFAEVRKTFDDIATAEWDSTVGFLASNAQLFKQVRNDLGGHFGTAAAKFAIESFTPGTTGSLEIVRDYLWSGIMYRPQFVGEVTARAFLRHLPGKDTEDKLRGLLEKVREAQRLATRAISNLLHFYLWPRFG
jgi:hypothetical protein